MQFVTPPRVGLAAAKIEAVMGLVGSTAVLGQIVLMREAIVVFNGNEVSLGIVLATWLLWTSAGSVVAGRLEFGRERTRLAVVITECAAGLSLLPTLWLLRISRSFFQTVPGELVGPMPMLVTSWICFSVFCFLCGFFFVVGAQLFQQEVTVSATSTEISVTSTNAR